MGLLLRATCLPVIDASAALIIKECLSSHSNHTPSLRHGTPKKVPYMGVSDLDETLRFAVQAHKQALLAAEINLIAPL